MVMRKGKMKVKKYKVGSVGVDSGTILICDPCYIKEDYDYEKVVEPTLGKPFAEALGGLGFVTTAGYGDGCYDVIVEVVEDPPELGGWERVKSITVEFIKDE
jgi:hypothetical protein